ncbi:MAG: ABC transporter ATP-binding protein [Myxococcota bacterium]
MDTAPLVSLKGVTRSFSRTQVLGDVDLDVFPGEVLGLIGPNGGGKSTLLLLMAGLISPSQGTVQVGGISAEKLAVQQRGSVGLITAEPGVYPLLSGWENLEFFGRLFGMGRAQTRERVAPWLDELHLAPHMDRRTGTWSSGMKQKLSVIRARLLQPKVLLLDEPTANLDPLSADAIYRVCRSEADAGLAVVIVTHDLRAAELLCDRVAIIEGGVRHIETMPGQRQVPTPSHLLPLYQHHVERR